MKKPILTYAICILTAVFFVYCSKDDPKKQEIPESYLPTIISIDPTAGDVGISVTIDGTNFSDTPANNIVKFNGTKATVTDASITQLTVTVPSGATNGKITVEVNGEEATSMQTFTVLKTPTINNFNPAQGILGTVVTINGSKFSTTPSDNIVTFNGVTATVNSATANELQVTVPNGATTGEIRVSVDGQTAVSTEDFTVPEPTISNFTPNQGTIGTEVTITGNNFSTVLENNIVEFNGIPATVIEALSTQLIVTAPEGTYSGKISVNVGGQEVESTEVFTLGPWRSLEVFPGTTYRENGVMAVLEDEGGNPIIYAGLGESFGSYPNDIWSYTEANGWSQEPNFEGASRKYAYDFVLDNKWYIGGGYGTGGALQDLWVYDPVTEEWQELDPINFHTSTFSTFVINGKAYVFGGEDENNKQSELWEFTPSPDFINDPNGTWSQKTSLLVNEEGRSGCTGISVNNKGYLVSGRIGGPWIDEIWEYDPLADSWDEKSSFAGDGRTVAIGFTIDDTGYVGLGYPGIPGTSLNDLWKYDANTDSWSQMSQLPNDGVLSSSVVVMNGKAFVVFGNINNESTDNQFWEYNPEFEE
ncbi:IPT/TIG domain-containing protein [Flagellimonas myxillae]|uniref:IPT/TIG domain-containing protein n=1 Tax=Flagellimonas myxillae TaxID=2942214 RepID=UPI00201F66C6|nr:IPT/TIG domain-containing protein [Muricauda myxillae]MCL6267724.1 IPT/TIG domain-containing protein [Muricauda myxillae]